MNNVEDEYTVAIIITLAILLPLVIIGGILIFNILVWAAEKRRIRVNHTILSLLIGLISLGNITILPVISIEVLLIFMSIYLRVKKRDILANICLTLVSILAVSTFFRVTTVRYENVFF